MCEVDIKGKGREDKVPKDMILRAWDQELGARSPQASRPEARETRDRPWRSRWHHAFLVAAQKGFAARSSTAIFGPFRRRHRVVNRRVRKHAGKPRRLWHRCKECRLSIQLAVFVRHTRRVKRSMRWLCHGEHGGVTVQGRVIGKRTAT